MTYEEYLRALPKVELHCHFMGSVPVGAMAALIARHKTSLPVDVHTLYANINSPNRPNPIYAKARVPVPVSDPSREPNPSYPLLDVSRWITPLFKDREDFATAIHAALGAFTESHIRYCEMFFEPTLFADEGIPYPTMVDGLIDGLRQAERDWGIRCRLVAGINRAQPPARAVQLVEEMVANPRDEVIGIGIEDYELSGYPELFVEAYQLAERHGLHRTAHASEHRPSAESITVCLDKLHCERIDHGYFILEDDSVVARARDLQIPFTTISTTSRRSWRGWRRTCIRMMDAAGLNVIIGADDPGMFPTNLSNEYVIGGLELGFDRARMNRMCLAAVDASWQSASEKQAMRAQFTREIDRLTAEGVSPP